MFESTVTAVSKYVCCALWEDRWFMDAAIAESRVIDRAYGTCNGSVFRQIVLYTMADSLPDQ